MAISAVMILIHRSHLCHVFDYLLRDQLPNVELLVRRLWTLVIPLATSLSFVCTELFLFISLCLFFVANFIAKSGVWCFILHLLDSEDNALSVFVFKFILFSLLTHALCFPMLSPSPNLSLLPASRGWETAGPRCALAASWALNSASSEAGACVLYCVLLASSAFPRGSEWSDHAPSFWHSKYS